MQCRDEELAWKVFSGSQCFLNALHVTLNSSRVLASLHQKLRSTSRLLLVSFGGLHIHNFLQVSVFSVHFFFSLLLSLEKALLSLSAQPDALFCILNSGEMQALCEFVLLKVAQPHGLLQELLLVALLKSVHQLLARIESVFVQLWMHLQWYCK